MKLHHKNAHEFALYYSLTSTYKDSALQSDIVIQDKDLVHRMSRVLRLKSSETVILFDSSYHMHAELKEVEKKSVNVVMQKITKNTEYKPSIICALPLLKRTALHEAVYGLVECGVTEIQLFTTDKVQRSWDGDKELDRLHKVCIAAAEQSKHFAVPDVHTPISLQACLQKYSNTTRIVFDLNGDHAQALINIDKDKPVVVFVGPEGDLTHEEKDLLHHNNVQRYQLTPTILRAQQAAVVGCGLLRSLIGY